MPWVAWLAVAAALGAAEFFTLTLAFGLLAAAALVAAVVAGLGGAFLVQVLAFALTSAAGLFVVRPIARRHMRQPPLIREGSDALVGQTAIVTQEVSPLHGVVHLGGEDWSARSFDEDHVIPVGAKVDVMEIKGATAIVYPHNLLP